MSTFSDYKDNQSKASTAKFTQDMMDEIYRRLMADSQNDPHYWCPGCKKEVILNRIPTKDSLHICLECGSTELPVTSNPNL